MDRKQQLLTSLKSEDDLGVVVRSLIIIEQYINEIVESAMISPEYFRNIKLDFSYKVKLALSIGLDPNFEKILSTLGTIRNDFAHNLRSVLGKQDVNNLYQNLCSNDKKLLQEIFQYFKANIPEFKQAQFQSISSKDKFILIVVFITGTLSSACEQLPNKAIKQD
ncbi:hypothetical protein KO495_10305 [Colwellia sp. D2M02]|uniref:hypothetical protein n=1 Tax=Colwellia sp. D2M02 TaxID=2841562 RepID=UPI001C0849E5|nr:hypothetical protein [Colwellia sp. D2M02]MBU2893712.1 hypothetical protein [Colwellia sp. D2M02]